jgi:hypothetical protein
MQKLTPSELRRKKAALTIVKTLSHETSVVSKPLTAVDIKAIPNDSEPAIKEWIRKHKKHIVYGSGAMATRSFTARQPADLDIVVDHPRIASAAFAKILRSKGHAVKVNHDPVWGAYVIQVRNAKGEYVDAIDVHPLRGFAGKYELYGSTLAPTTRNGVNLQVAADQLLRKANSVTGTRKDGRMGAAEHREVKDTADFVSVARMLAASMEVRSEADRAKISEVKAAIKVWERHLGSLKGVDGLKSAAKRVPLSKTKKQQFVRAATRSLESDVDDLVFEDTKRVAIHHAPAMPAHGAARGLYGYEPTELYPASHGSERRAKRKSKPKGNGRAGRRKSPKMIGKGICDVPEIDWGFQPPSQKYRR